MDEQSDNKSEEQSVSGKGEQQDDKLDKKSAEKSDKQSVAGKSVDRYLKDSFELSPEAEKMYTTICGELGLDNILKLTKKVSSIHP